jgi:Predicted Zn peptidase
MCQEIYDYKNEHNNDFSNYFNLKDIDKDAESLLNKFINNKSNKLNGENNLTDIIKIARIMGFKIFHTQLEKDKRELSGMIGISKKFEEKFGSDKIIILNSIDSDEHMLFTIAHEIAHYIYDYNPNLHKKEYFNKYKTDEAQTDEEKRANRFAAAFLMPAEKFNSLFDEKNSLEKNIKILATEFKVPQTAVEQRIIELGLI